MTGGMISRRTVSVLIFLLMELAVEKIQDGVAFIRIHILDADGELRIDEQHLAACHRMLGHHRMNDGRIIEHWGLLDSAGLTAQLGLTQ